MLTPLPLIFFGMPAIIACYFCQRVLMLRAFDGHFD